MRRPLVLMRRRSPPACSCNPKLHATTDRSHSGAVRQAAAVASSARFPLRLCLVWPGWAGITGQSPWINPAGSSSRQNVFYVFGFWAYPGKIHEIPAPQPVSPGITSIPTPLVELPSQTKTTDGDGDGFVSFPSRRDASPPDGSAVLSSPAAFFFDGGILPAQGLSQLMAPSSWPTPPPAVAAASDRLAVLYASQTGNAMDAAERVGREAERGGCPAVDVLSMDSFDPSCLPGERFVVFVVSTTGQGDPPDSMKGFWRYLLRKDLGAWWLEGLRYAVFGLGDSGYQKYNFAAKKLDKRLLDLGAEPIIEKGLGDDQHPSGYEGALDPWLLSLWKSLNQTNTSVLPRISDIIHPNLNILGDAKVEVIYYPADEVPQDFNIPDSKKLIERARSMSPALKFHNDGEPQYMLRMVTNQRLTKEDSDRDVRHFELEDPYSAISYQVGDALEILPSQNPSAVDAFIERCNLDPDCYIMIQAKGGNEVSNGSVVNGLMDRIKLKTFVALTMDVASASPRRYFFEIMSYFATAEHEKERLQYFASSEGRDDLYQYNQKESRTVLEALEDFPSVQMPFEWLVQLTPPLKKRAFSISSSPLAHPNQIHLTVSIVSWLTPFKRTRHGLCSTWLAGFSPNEENLIPCWIQQGSLPPTLPWIPLVLIGPGTGCAPFRAFVEERAAQSVTKQTAPVLFFFGCRNQDSDFLYKDFWLKHAQDQGVLSTKKGGGFFVAFSRDQPQKVYVQHKIKEQSARVWNILCSGAAIYVAGSSTKMPADVTAALEEIVCQEGGVPKEAASAWLRKLERAGRFNIETWS